MLLKDVVEVDATWDIVQVDTTEDVVELDAAGERLSGSYNWECN